MDATQYRDAIDMLGLSQTEAAEWLGISLRTSQNYALGEHAIPEPVAKFLLLVVALDLKPETVTKLIDEPRMRWLSA